MQKEQHVKHYDDGSNIESWKFVVVAIIILRKRNCGSASLYWKHRPVARGHAARNNIQHSAPFRGAANQQPAHRSWGKNQQEFLYLHVSTVLSLIVDALVYLLVIVVIFIT